MDSKELLDLRLGWFLETLPLAAIYVNAADGRFDSNEKSAAINENSYSDVRYILPLNENESNENDNDLQWLYRKLDITLPRLSVSWHELDFKSKLTKAIERIESQGYDRSKIIELLKDQGAKYSSLVVYTKAKLREMTFEDKMKIYEDVKEDPLYEDTLDQIEKYSKDIGVNSEEVIDAIYYGCPFVVYKDLVSIVIRYTGNIAMASSGVLVLNRVSKKEKIAMEEVAYALQQEELDIDWLLHEELLTNIRII